MKTTWHCLNRKVAAAAIDPGLPNVNTLSRLVMILRRRCGIAIGSLATVGVSMVAYPATAPGDVHVEAAVAALSGDLDYPAVTAFGMAGRGAILVGEQPVLRPSGTTGQQMFDTQCITCHGTDARGVEGLGVGLADSRFVRSATQDELIAFLRVGRMPNDPATVTGMVMPGFAWIAEQDLVALAGYIKNLAE